MLASEDAKNQTLGLCPADCAVQLPIIAPLYFENSSDSTPEFMDFDILKTSFYHTLATCLPHALGTNLRKPTDGSPMSFLVTVNPTTPKLPPVTRHVDDECTIAAMRQAGFLPHVQPKTILCEMAKAVINPVGGDPLVALDVVYMSDGVGVLLMLSHGIVDMGAYCRFIVEWGLVAKVMACGANGVPRGMDTDREKFWAQVTESAVPVSPTPFEEHLAELSAAGAEPTEAGKAPASLFILSADVAAVKKLAQTRDAMCPGISVPNFISALLMRVIASSYTESKYAYFSSSLTVRNNPLFSEYWGNTSTAKYTYAPRAQLLEEGVGGVARWIQDCVREFSAGDFAHILGLFAMDNSWYVHSLNKYVGEAGVPKLLAVNISRSIPFYDIDFGWGRPVKVVYRSVCVPGLCFYMPQSRDGGIEVIICLAEVATNALLADELILSHFVVAKIPGAEAD
ncbi:hypothetical protein GGI24_000119 [Coemansia furcata]|nr:hypothetical protein GGI24_000119 [Coemansia furcata]